MSSRVSPSRRPAVPPVARTRYTPNPRIGHSRLVSSGARSARAADMGPGRFSGGFEANPRHPEANPRRPEASRGVSRRSEADQSDPTALARSHVGLAGTGGAPGRISGRQSWVPGSDVGSEWARSGAGGGSEGLQRWVAARAATHGPPCCLPTSSILVGVVEDVIDFVR
jgi:hypothetical protein